MRLTGGHPDRIDEVLRDVDIRGRSMRPYPTGGIHSSQGVIPRLPARIGRYCCLFLRAALNVSANVRLFLTGSYFGGCSPFW